MVRAMQEAGDELRKGKIAPLPTATTTALRQDSVKEATTP
jgi:hypothetical protein